MVPLPVLLMTRPEAQSRAFAQGVGVDGEDFRLVISPLIGVVVTGPLPDMAPYRGVIFTSANAVDAYAALGGRRDLPAFCVGDATADAARALGLDATSAEGNAETLIALLTERRPDAPLVHPRGQHARGDIAGRLSARGIATRAAVVYDQPALPLTDSARAALSGSSPVVAPVFSPRSGALLSEEPVKAPLLVAAMSVAVAKAVEPLHKRDLMTASRPDSRAMRSLVADLLRRARAGEH